MIPNEGFSISERFGKSGVDVRCLPCERSRSVAPERDSMNVNPRILLVYAAYNESDHTIDGHEVDARYLGGTKCTRDHRRIRRLTQSFTRSICSDTALQVWMRSGAPQRSPCPLDVSTISGSRVFCCTSETYWPSSRIVRIKPPISSSMSRKYGMAKKSIRGNIRIWLNEQGK